MKYRVFRSYLKNIFLNLKGLAIERIHMAKRIIFQLIIKTKET